ncbi:hypothetical protein VE03_00108 [Pseudogymnoascus sp. 23342-1-I1]|nr:hypothetical protein VE03_00108 [Pseudogymnoascus sp. 23342-1-I1]
MTGLAFSSLLGGMAAARIVETLARTGGFAPRVARNRILALNGLKGFNITEPKVNLMAEPREPNLTGLALIPNPSVLTVKLGTVTMNISTNEKGLIGNRTIGNFVLKPGKNLLPMTSIVDTGLALGSVDDKGIVNMIIVEQTAVYNGVHLPYYEAALKSHTLTLAVNLQSLLGSV